MGVTGILLAGGIGSGKSTAAGMLAARGAIVVSADHAARRIMEPGGEAFQAVAARWPEVVVGDRIDRGHLARIVFAAPEQLAELEAMTHPAVRAAVLREVADVTSGLVVVEIPLLVDIIGAGWPVVVVDAPDETRRRRLVGRGMDAGDIERRMANQPSRRQWLEAADHVLDNSRDLAHLADECARLLQQIHPA